MAGGAVSRDCGVRAYGIGFVASAAGMRWRAEAIEAFLAAAREAFEHMRADPAAVLRSATRVQHDLDAAYAAAQWETEEEEVVFGYQAAEQGLGASDMRLWAETVSWRREVARLPRSPEPETLVWHA